MSSSSSDASGSWPTFGARHSRDSRLPGASSTSGMNTSTPSMSPDHHASQLRADLAARGTMPRLPKRGTPTLAAMTQVIGPPMASSRGRRATVLRRSGRPRNAAINARPTSACSVEPVGDAGAAQQSGESHIRLGEHAGVVGVEQQRSCQTPGPQPRAADDEHAQRDAGRRPDDGRVAGRHGQHRPSLPVST
jgi:hypothetical protein